MTKWFWSSVVSLLTLLVTVGLVPVAGQVADTRPKLPPFVPGPPPGMRNPPTAPKVAPPTYRTPSPAVPSRVEKLSESTLRIGAIHVDPTSPRLE